MRARTTSRRLRRHGGFSIIELFVALSIVAILAAAGLAMFRSQSLKARRAEAVMGLKAIHRAQRSYFAQNNGFGDTFDELGLSLDGATRVDAQTLRGETYTFTMRALPLGGNARGNFQAIATGDLDPGDGVLDVLMIENGLTVSP
ncbi:hypothetical protein MYXO_01491 [Myxococcaceae bacterium]|jgi:prepilin-type N-terminal cleavage/methylation domain-containing protein|nr:hypothetical protein MYXO_01491 [Myxococcaceae bacterium]